MGDGMTEISQWAEWAEISTIVAATAGLWALWFAWVTYVTSIVQQNKDEFQGLNSIVRGLRVELDLMEDWTKGPRGQGYSKTIAYDAALHDFPDWLRSDRMIWKFDIGAISNLTRSPYLYGLGKIVGPFTKLSFSVSRLFQLHDEYRSFVNSNPALVTQPPDWAKARILEFNFEMHVKLIGGTDSDDPECLYRAYNAATSALDNFGNGLTRRKLPLWFWIGHLLAAACFISGALLLYELFR
jgi:hypothetical protein